MDKCKAALHNQIAGQNFMKQLVAMLNNPNMNPEVSVAAWYYCAFQISDPIMPFCIRFKKESPSWLRNGVLSSRPWRRHPYATSLKSIKHCSSAVFNSQRSLSRQHQRERVLVEVPSRSAGKRRLSKSLAALVVFPLNSRNLPPIWTWLRVILISQMKLSMELHRERKVRLWRIYSALLPSLNQS